MGLGRLTCMQQQWIGSDELAPSPPSRVRVSVHLGRWLLTSLQPDGTILQNPIL